MRLTKHAATRVQQRGIPNTVIEFILMFGAIENADRGALKYKFTKKSFSEAEHYLKDILQTLGRMKNRCVLVDGSGESIITAY